MEPEDKSASPPKKNPMQSKAGVLSYVAQQYQAVHALADPDDAEAQAYLARLGKILDAAEAEETASGHGSMSPD